MRNLKKLFNLKPWLTLPDAARHLSISFGEDVSEADVLRLGLDRHLTFSVNFVMAGPVFGAASKSKTHDNTFFGKGGTNHVPSWLPFGR